MPPTEVPTLRKRKNPSGKKTFFADFYIDSKRTRVTLGPRKDLAEKQASKIFSDLQNQQAGLKPKASAMSLQELVDAFLHGKEGRASVATIRRHGIYSGHLVDFFTNKMSSVKVIDQITNAHLDECITTQRKEAEKTPARKKSTKSTERGKSPQKPKTLNGQIEFTKELFKTAVVEGRLTTSPADRLKRYQERKDETPPNWTKEEVNRILDATDVVWRDVFEFLYHTGQRKSEMIHLTWQDLHLVSLLI